jgi:uncharacterized LabA/DUF88 family protein
VEIAVMFFHPEERVALFIDGSNLYATSRSLGFDIDYKKLLGHFRDRSRLLRAIYYTALLDDAEYSPIRPLIDWLDYNGYTVVTKPAKEFTDALGRRKVKGNMDIELAVDVMRLCDSLDHIVLFSGDGDFRSLVEAVQERGRRVTVISTLATRPAMVADDLRRQADQFIDIMDLKPAIGRDPAERECAVSAWTPAGTSRTSPKSEAAWRTWPVTSPPMPEAPYDCPLCPRLVAFRTDQRAAHPDWFNGPVASFGDPAARLLIVGLAPGLRGANRTGRPFTGDFAGDLLYDTLRRFGFAAGPIAPTRRTGSNSPTA